MKQILVYGSLRKGKQAHRYLTINHANFIGEIRLTGYDMLKLGWFPGIIANPENKEGIVGELYEVPDHLFDGMIETLDYYEGYFPDNPDRSLFVRQEVMCCGKPTIIYTYNGKRNAEIVNSVPSGDWANA
jgi:gamma-glutamylcyclotransferase (GGCT)/AIG2-like uncharacterized protein YtfP